MSFTRYYCLHGGLSRHLQIKGGCAGNGLIACCRRWKTTRLLGKLNVPVLVNPFATRIARFDFRVERAGIGYNLLTVLCLHRVWTGVIHRTAREYRINGEIWWFLARTVRIIRCLYLIPARLKIATCISGISFLCRSALGITRLKVTEAPYHRVIAKHPPLFDLPAPFKSGLLWHW